MAIEPSAFRRLQGIVFARIRHRDAASVPDGAVAPWDLRSLRGRHCILVTYRADGTPVPTPVWFALHRDRVLLRTGSDAYKVKRLRRTPTVLIAPSTGRGRPTGAAMEGWARILDPAEEPAAERALRTGHGLLRRLYANTVDARLPTVYIEIGPRPSADRPS
jgi:PPOX class probable F420-dependent enzyme